MHSGAPPGPPPQGPHSVRTALTRTPATAGSTLKRDQPNPRPTPPFRRPHPRLAGPRAAAGGIRPPAGPGRCARLDRRPPPTGDERRTDRRCLRRGPLRRTVGLGPGPGRGPAPQAGLQPHRDRAAHQPGPRAPPRGGGGRPDPGRPGALRPGVRPRGRRPRRPRHPGGGVAQGPHRGRGGHRGQQQRRRRLPDAQHPGAAQGGGGLPGRAGGDRRGLPHSGHHGPRRGQAARSRDHQPHPPARLRRGHRPPDRRWS